MLNAKQFNLSQPQIIKNEIEKNAYIIKMIMTLKENYSEFLEYTGEITITIPNLGTPEITMSNITDNNNELAQMIKRHNEDYACKGK